MRHLTSLLEAGGIADNTRTRYQQSFNRFEKWYDQTGKSIMEGKEMDECDELCWLLWLAHEDLSSTFEGIKARIFGVKFHFKMKFGFDPFRTDRFGRPVAFLRFEQVLRQIKRKSKTCRARKFSVTKFVLIECKRHVDLSSFDDIVCWAIVSVGVACLLRWSEISDSGRGGGGRAKILNFADLGMSGDYMWLNLKDTKTRLFGDPMTVELKADSSDICPLKAMKSWLSVRPKGSKWLFCRKDESVIKTRWVQNIVKGWLRKAGYNDNDLKGGISLRKGGALGMALAGVPDRVIRAHGRWKSNAYRTYIDLTKHEKEWWWKVVSDKVKLAEEGRISMRERPNELDRATMNRIIFDS